MVNLKNVCVNRIARNANTPIRGHCQTACLDHRGEDILLQLNPRVTCRVTASHHGNNVVRERRGQ